MALCECGCGQTVTKIKGAGEPRRFISGHNLRNLPRSATHRSNLSKAQTNAWRTKRNRMPLGSKNYDSKGYVRVKVVEGSGRWIPEHKMVMESLIGRALKPGEAVHHINGVRSDNRPENLYLFANNAEHMFAEASLAQVFRELMAAGFARFNRGTGRYELVADTPDISDFEPARYMCEDMGGTTARHAHDRQPSFDFGGM